MIDEETYEPGECLAPIPPGSAPLHHPQSIYLPTSIHLSIYLRTSIYISANVHPSVHPSAHVHLYICLRPSNAEPGECLAPMPPGSAPVHLLFHITVCRTLTQVCPSPAQVCLALAGVSNTRPFVSRWRVQHVNVVEAHPGGC